MANIVDSTNIRFREEDGSPSVLSPTEVLVSNGSLTDNMDGTVSINTSGGGGGSGTGLAFLVEPTNDYIHTFTFLNTTTPTSVPTTFTSGTIDLTDSGAITIPVGATHVVLRTSAGFAGEQPSNFHLYIEENATAISGIGVGSINEAKIYAQLTTTDDLANVSATYVLPIGTGNTVAYRLDLTRIVDSQFGDAWTFVEGWLLPATGGGGGATVLTSDTDFYVATTGNDVTGDGTVGNPWATAQFAIEEVANKYVGSAYDVTINFADGTYLLTESVKLRKHSVKNIILAGNPASRTSVKFDGNALYNCFEADFHSSYRLLDLTATNCTNSFLISSQQSNVVIEDCRAELFTGVNQRIIYITGDQAYIRVFNSFEYQSGGSINAMVMALAASSSIFCNSCSFTQTGAPSFSFGFAYAGRNSTVSMDSTTSNGAFGGTRFNAQEDSVIFARTISGYSGSDSTLTGGTVYT